MASIQRTIPFPNSPIPFSYPLSRPKLAAARHRLLTAMKASVRAIEAEISRLETTGELAGADIDNTIESLAWAVDSFREEQEMEPIEAALEAQTAALCAEWSQPSLFLAKRGSGRFDGGLRSGMEAAWLR